MSVEIAHDTHRQIAVLYDTTSDWAFGPVFNGPGCDEDAADFLWWLARNHIAKGGELHHYGGRGEDPRDYTDSGLERAYHTWLDAADNRRGVEA